MLFCYHEAQKEIFSRMEIVSGTSRILPENKNLSGNVSYQAVKVELSRVGILL